MAVGGILPWKGRPMSDPQRLSDELRKSAEAQRHDGPDMGWKRMRDQVREIIRAEVDKLNPTEDARRPLELIIETAVRYTEVDGKTVITVVDENGQPRTIDKDGKIVSFTIHDLVEELRLSHPILFKSMPPSPQLIDAPSVGELPAKAETDDAALDRREPDRDWLDVGSSAMSQPDPSQPDPSQPAAPQPNRGEVRFGSWSRNALRRWIRPANAAGAANLEPAPTDRSSMPVRVEQFSGRRPLRERRGLALGVCALAALLAAGGYAFLGREGSPQDRSDEPAITGALSSETTASQAAASPPTATAKATTARSLRGVPDVLDTSTLSLQGEVVRLFGVEWAPGAGKPDDLIAYLRGREVACEPAGSADTYRCKVGDQDLSKVVLFNGGGRATPDASPELKAAADKARSAQLGVWSK
jgi:endonuclease YncB( thermonuclease family)